MTFRVGNRIPDADLSPWFESQGIMQGCEVVAGPGLTLTVNPGMLNFQNGASVEITHAIVSVIRIIPHTYEGNKEYRLVCSTNSKDLSFNLVDPEVCGDFIRQSGGILLAKLIVTYPCVGKESIFVYNAIPHKGEKISIITRPLSYPDGENTVFKLPVKLNAEFCCKVVCGGVPQDEFIDYTVGSWVCEDGEEYSYIVFTEPPGNGIDIVVTAYIGKIRLVD